MKENEGREERKNKEHPTLAIWLFLFILGLGFVYTVIQNAG